jgi:hypothetical protein
MKLSQQDANLFYTLMWSLQFFVKQRVKIAPELETLEEYKTCATDVKLKVREALYENIDLINAFIQANPEGLSEDMLAIIASWKHFVAGNFYIERYLKKYTVFISSDNNVYAVLGLYDAFEDLFHRSRLPMYVKAVLLPFKDTIIYDSLLQGYNVFFGHGIASNLKETYLAAKQNDRIIERLPAGSSLPTVRTSRQPTRDGYPELDNLAAKAKTLRASADQPPVLSPSLTLVKASLELAQVAVSAPDDVATLWSVLKKVNRAVKKVETTLYRAER